LYWDYRTGALRLLNGLYDDALDLEAIVDPDEQLGNERKRQLSPRTRQD
jgi:hypothetical protein